MTGKKALDKILIIFNMLGLLAGTGVFIFTEFISQRELPLDPIEFQRLLNESIENSNLKPFKLKKLTLNLYSEKSRLRYLDVTMHLLPFHERQLSTIERFISVIYDNVIEITGRMRPEEINSLTGKILYEDRIKRMSNDVMGKAVIKKIYFTRFVIQ